MKMLAGKLPFAMTGLLALLSPLVGSSQSISRQVATPSDQVGLLRLTFLPGPYFLSSARGVLQSAGRAIISPEPSKAGAAPAFRFVPDSERFLRGKTRTVRLLEINRFNPLSISGRLSDPSRDSQPVSLRFNSILHPTPLPLKSR